MENDFYLNALNKIVNSPLFTEEEKVVELCGEVEIREKDTIKRKIKVDLCSVKFKLEDGRFLIVEGKALDFILMFGILIGDNSQLFEAEIEGEDGKFVFSEELSNNLPIKKKTLHKIDTDTIQGLKFEIPFDEIPMIRDLKEFMKEKEVDFNTIHLFKGDEVRCFTPTLRHSDFSLAQRLDIPLFPLIHDAFIIDTNINVYDNSRQEEILKPLSKRIVEEETIVNSRTHNRVYLDVRNIYCLNIDDNYLEDMLDKIDIIEDKEKIWKYLSRKQRIILNENKEGLAFFFWKSLDDGKRITFSSRKEFAEYTGVDFYNDKNYLENLIVYDEHGKECMLKYSFFKDEIRNIIKSSENEKNIYYNSYEELFIKMIITEIKKARRGSLLDVEKKKELMKRSLEILHRYTKSIAQTSTIPQNTESLTSKAYSSLAYKLNNVLDNIEKEEKGIGEIYGSAIKLFSIVDESKDMCTNYDLEVIIAVLVRLLATVDVDNKKEYLNEFTRLYDNQIEPKEDRKSEDILEGILSARKYMKKEKVIAVVHDKISSTLLPKDVEITEIKNYEKRYELKEERIRELFTRNSEEIISDLRQTKGLKPNTELEIFGKRYKLKEDFFKEHRVYKGYKVLWECDAFDLLSPLSN